MTDFTSGSIRLAGQITLSGPIDEVFELFSPLGERLWVPGWDPTLLHPAGASWEEGLIFRTREETGEAVWVVTLLDRAAHEVKYYRVEPGRYVARVGVRCAPVPGQGTEASVAYEFVGLSEAGNAAIAAMTPEGYAQKMARWTGWINDYLGSRAASGTGNDAKKPEPD